jgi:NADH-quinone oxidoreductase subunit M
MPVYGSFTSLAFFAALGLPGLSSFISELLVLLGGWKNFPGITVLCASGIVLGAAYMLWTLQRVFLGPLNEKYKDLPEINKREIFTLVPLAIMTIVFGFYPQPILNLLQASTNHLVELVWQADRLGIR